MNTNRARPRQAFEARKQPTVDGVAKGAKRREFNEKDGDGSHCVPDNFIDRSRRDEKLRSEIVYKSHIV
ncbi:hypothetical protein JCM15519_27030 [Fundidesulfovibrio butyratiphilus]